MRFVGRLEEWNDDRGFGFVSPNGGGARAFVHIKSFERRARRPVIGDLISYDPQPDGQHRLNAVQIRFVETPAPVRNERRDWFPRKLAASVFLTSVIAAGSFGKIPALVAWLYVAMSVITYFAYWLDKRAARANRWRTEENTLHLLELVGGWPGALLAQGHFRHKTRKTSFLIVFVMVVMINLGVVVWLLHTGKAETANQWLLPVIFGAARH